MGKLNAKAKAGDEIIKVGITSSCKGDAVSQAAQDVSGCFRKSEGNANETLKIQASDIVVLYHLRTSQTGRGFSGKCDGSAASLENSCWLFN